MNNQTMSEIKKPPIVNIGVIGLLRKNLFSTWYNTIFTIIGLQFSLVFLGDALLPVQTHTQS